jgi:hypothetical protein
MTSEDLHGWSLPRDTNPYRASLAIRDDGYNKYCYECFARFSANQGYIGKEREITPALCEKCRSKEK